MAVPKVNVLRIKSILMEKNSSIKVEIGVKKPTVKKKITRRNNLSRNIFSSPASKMESV